MKYRCSPTDEQRSILAHTFGYCWYVYNWELRKKTDVCYKDNQRLYYKDLSEALTMLKKQDAYIWLSLVSSVPLQQSLRHLDRAFFNFFEGRGKYPTFKKKRNRQAATYTSNAFSWNGKQITLAKMNDPLDIVWSRPLPHTETTIGADLGLQSFVVLSDGEVVGNPKFFHQDEKKLAKA